MLSAASATPAKVDFLEVIASPSPGWRTHYKSCGAATSTKSPSNGRETRRIVYDFRNKPNPGRPLPRLLRGGPALGVSAIVEWRPFCAWPSARFPCVTPSRIDRSIEGPALGVVLHAASCAATQRFPG